MGKYLNNPSRIRSKITIERILMGILVLFLLISMAKSAFAAAGPAADVQILQNSSSGINLRYRTPEVTWIDLNASGRQYRSPIVLGTSYAYPEGAPQIPVRVIWLAIPPEATARLTVSTPAGIASLPYVPAPVPADSVTPDGNVIPVYRESPAYYSNSSPLPGSWVELQGPQTYRDLNTIRLLIYPFRFAGNNSGLLALDSIDVRVEFQGGQQVSQSFPRPIEDDYYRGLIANWSGVARNWKAQKLQQANLVDPWPAGDFYKIRTSESGMYHLTYSDLVSAGINPQGLDLRTIRIFNNGGEQLPKDLVTPRPSGPIENAILVLDKNQNNQFDSDDEIIFYGKSVNEWKWNPNWNSGQGRYEHYLNPYTDSNVYWLSINSNGPQGKRMLPLGLQTTPTNNPVYTRAYIFEEKSYYAIYDDYDLPVYMPNLFGDLFSGSSSRTFTISLSNVYASANAHLKLKLQSGDSSSHLFNIYLNNEPLLSSSNTSTPIEIDISPGTLNNGINTLRLDHVSASAAYLDYYELEYARSLTASSGREDFISPAVDGYAQYNLQQFVNPRIFDVTSFSDVKTIQAPSFTDEIHTYSPKRYIACDDNALLTPQSINKDQRSGDEYTDLRSTLGADILVIVADEFYDAMKAYEDYRETSAPTPAEVLRVRMSDIFDEYGWGLQDPTAIRDFLKSTLPIYNWAVSPLYVLFVGDGDFDYKNSLSATNDNFVIPYVSGSECTDDWYSYFTPQANDAYAYPEVASGRWTARSVEDVNTFISRLISYESNPDFGPWRDQITFVADDEYKDGQYSSSETLHIQYTENLAEHYVPKFFNEQKIYLTEYPLVWDPSGGRQKPDATRDLINAINDGRLLINFMGHGNPTVWTHEHVFLQSRDLPLLRNENRLPLFLAATCDWAYWDSPFSQSMPEVMLTMPDAGAIAAIAATRTTGPSSNALFVNNFYTELFWEETGQRLGEALMRSKARVFVHNPGNGYINNSNTEKYHLLGDPYMRLAMPQLKVALDSSQVDTVNALGEVAVSGRLTTSSGLPVTGFQGVARLQLIDVRIPVFYGFNNGPPPSTPTYILPGNLIFRGDVSVQDGQFVSNFIVPVDISYGESGGRVSVYAYSDVTDGIGYVDSVTFGASAVALQDSTPPQLKVYFDNPGFRSGDPVGSQSVLYVEVADSNGVNITGSVGHALMVTIDDLNPINLTSSFSYYLNSHTTGRAEYQLTPGEFSAGQHTAHAIAWDAANNPSVTEVVFNLLSSGELQLTQLLNYPNPFKDQTRFTFYLTEPAQVTIKVYTVAGRMVRVLSDIPGNASFNYDDPHLQWDGRDSEGDLLSNGVYLYKVIAKGISGKEVLQTSKLVVMR
ncbi:MAG: type IX secretion system sortase PorU [bacterium]|nr:type IX secretion system sortase PorU [bacterium]